MKKRKWKQMFGALILAVGVAIVAMTINLACTQDELKRATEEFHVPAPATQTAEKIQQKLDPIAEKGSQVAVTVQHGAEGAAAIGIPGAGAVALIAGAIGHLLGAYVQRRKGTIPMQNAFEQVVGSVEAAFPSKTEQQKTAMAAVQDESTRRLVDKVKGS
jgi:hypothetical protein